LSDEGVKFVIGHFNSSVTIAASEIYARKGVLFITPSASDPTVTDQGLWNAFRLAPRADEVGRAWGEYAGKKLRDKKIAIVSDEARFSRLLLGAARASMEAAGVKEVFHGDVSAGGSDYSGLAAKLLAANTDYVMWAAPPAGAVEVLRQMRDAGSTAHALIWADVLAGGEIRALGGPSIEGLLTAHIRESVDSAAAQDLFAKLRARGVEPGDFGLYSYVGVQILKEAAEKARSLEPRAVAEIMRSGGAFSTAIGDVAFDKSGDRKDPDFVWYALIPSGEGNYKLRPQE
jgi:branched-chain amino acid transport system substrate-binding protein